MRKTLPAPLPFPFPFPLVYLALRGLQEAGLRVLFRRALPELLSLELLEPLLPAQSVLGE